MLRVAALLILLLGAFGATSRASAQTVHSVKPLTGYQCMSLAKLWDGKGPQPPAVHVFAGPEATASSVGIAGGTVIVPDPIRPVDGRTSMVFPSGKIVWIRLSDIKKWHARAAPNARCRPVLLSNGRYGFDSGH